MLVDGEGAKAPIAGCPEKNWWDARTPQLRYCEEHGLISPTREHGKLRYSPRDLAIARLVKRLLEAGRSVDELRMLKEITQRDLRLAGSGPSEELLAELALRILYQRKAFVEEAGMAEEHYPAGKPSPPHHRGPNPRHRPGRHPR